ncbi:DUF1648 domain-containing protein [Paenalkalicoccus suaedae]|nr:DUF5808 domain-containing protein [Paenalkalicoccus suaedae]
MGYVSILLLLSLFIPIAIILTSIPFLTRKTESFGVSIPEKEYDSPILKSWRKRYVVIMLITSLILIIAFFSIGAPLSNNEQNISIFFACSILVYLAVAFLIYLSFHKKMKQLKKDSNWTAHKQQTIAIRTDFRTQKLHYSNLFYAIPFGITLLTAVLTYVFYSSLPDTLPVRINTFSGSLSSVETTIRSAFFLPIMQLYLLLVFVLLNTVIARSKQQLNAEDPERSYQQLKVFRRRWSLFLLLTSILLTALFSFIQWTYFYQPDPAVITYISLAITGMIVVAAMILSFSTGQGGSRITYSSGQEPTRIDRDDDTYWKLGQFYVNKHDPSLFLEKRFGVGWTINFARPLAWMILIGIIATAISLPLLLM